MTKISVAFYNVLLYIKERVTMKVLYKIGIGLIILGITVKVICLTIMVIV